MFILPMTASYLGGRLLKLHFSRIVGPMKQGLPLFPPTVEVPLKAGFLKLGDVPAHGPPPFYLTFVVRTPPPQEIPDVPLEPSPGVFVINPSLPPPDRQRLRGVDPEKIQGRIMALAAELGLVEPIGRELGGAVRHVLAAENPEFEHFLRGEFRAKIGVEVPARRLSQKIDVPRLHEVVDRNPPRFEIGHCSFRLRSVGRRHEPTGNRWSGPKSSQGSIPISTSGTAGTPRPWRTTL